MDVYLIFNRLGQSESLVASRHLIGCSINDARLALAYYPSEIFVKDAFQEDDSIF